MYKTIDELCGEVFGNSEDHGFWEESWKTFNLLKWADDAVAAKYTLDVKLSKIALIHSELGEMTEGVRKPGPDQHCPAFTQEEIELADVLIRAFDYAGAFQLRLAEAIQAKMDYNRSRPYKHGKGA